jgi:ATP-dependent Lon protease
MAAQRAGVTKVFIPKSNEADLKDVAKEVLDRIEVVPVSDVQELLNAVL